MSGELDDGTAGLWQIERRRGITVAQNPEEAAFPSMPLSALRKVEVDYTVKAADLGPLLARLTGSSALTAAAANDFEDKDMPEDAQLTDLTCPECRGTIWEIRRGKNKDYHCRVGHSYSAKSMLAGHFAAQEKAFYAAIVALEEGAPLATRLADQFEGEYGERLREEARQRQAEAIRGLVNQQVSSEI